MRRDHRRPLVHYGAPVLFLRGGISGGNQSSATTSSSSKVTTTSSSTSQQHTKIRSYTIRSGDTFGAIAIRFGVSVDDIVALNLGVEPTTLHVGQKIEVGKAPVAK